MYHKEGRAPKNWCFRITVLLLRVPWTARRSNQSILKEINPDYSLEGALLKLKLQYFGYLMRRADSLKKTLMLGKTEGRRRRGRQRIRWLDSMTNSMDMNQRKLWEIVEDRGAWRAAVHGAVKSQTWLSNWTTTNTQRSLFVILQRLEVLYSNQWYSCLHGQETGVTQEQNASFKFYLLFFSLSYWLQMFRWSYGQLRTLKILLTLEPQEKRAD